MEGVVGMESPRVKEVGTKRGRWIGKGREIWMDGWRGRKRREGELDVCIIFD